MHDVVFEKQKKIKVIPNCFYYKNFHISLDIHLPFKFE